MRRGSKEYFSHFLGILKLFQELGRSGQNKMKQFEPCKSQEVMMLLLFKIANSQPSKSGFLEMFRWMQSAKEEAEAGIRIILRAEICWPLMSFVCSYFFLQTLIWFGVLSCLARSSKRTHTVCIGNSYHLTSPGF